MKKLILFFLFVTSFAMNGLSQTQTQHGVARMITRAKSDPVVPVRDVEVIVGNSASKESDAQGRFSIIVPVNKEHSYKLTNVRLPRKSNLVLASPALSDKCYLNAGDLILAFTTAEDKQREYKTLYVNLQKRYNKQRDELQQLRDQLKEQRIELKEGSAAYQRLSARIDSAQSLLNLYFDEKQQENTTKELEHIAEQLASTDYQSLEKEEIHIYELMKEGEWPTLSTYLLTLWNGNAAAYVKEKLDARDAAKTVYEYASRDLDITIDRLKKAIESYKLQHLNDSVAHYYEILTRADSTNWDYLNQAGLFELQYTSHYTKANGYFQRALRYADEDSLRATTYNNLGSVWDEKDDYRQALELYQKALSIDSHIFGENSSKVASYYNNIGHIYKRLGDYSHALDYYQKALKCWQQDYDKSHVLNTGLLDAYNNLGDLFSLMDDGSHAKESYLKVLDFSSLDAIKIQGALANAYQGLGNIYKDQANYEQAEQYLRKALEIKQLLYGQTNPKVAVVYNDLGDLYLSKGDYDSAEEYLQKALQLDLAIYGERGSSVITAYNNLGELYEAKGDVVRAEECLAKALSMRLSLYGNLHPKVAISYNNLGGVYQAQGNFDLARVNYQKAYGIAEKVLGKEHKYTKIFKGNLENVINRLKDK